GWVVFACALLVFIWVAGHLGEAPPDAPTAGVRRAETVAGATGAGPQAAWRYGVAVAACLAVPALVYVSLLATEVRATAATLELPPGHLSWRAAAGAVDPLWRPLFVGAGAERRAHYQNADGQIVEVVAIGYPRQTRGAQILNNANSLLGQHGLAMEEVSLVSTGGIPHSEVVAVD